MPPRQPGAAERFEVRFAPFVGFEGYCRWPAATHFRWCGRLLVNQNFRVHCAIPPRRGANAPCPCHPRVRRARKSRRLARQCSRLECLRCSVVGFATRHFRRSLPRHLWTIVRRRLATPSCSMICFPYSKCFTCAIQPPIRLSENRGTPETR